MIVTFFTLLTVAGIVLLLVDMFLEVITSIIDKLADKLRKDG